VIFFKKKNRFFLKKNPKQTDPKIGTSVIFERL